MTKDREKLYTALSLWINYIETGDIKTSRDSILEVYTNHDDIKRADFDLPRLTQEQLRHLRCLRELQYKLSTGEEL